MKSFIFLVCTTVFSLNVENSFSQEKVIIENSRSLKVEQIFKIIQKQTNFDFIYPKRVFEDTPKIYLEKGELLATELLRICLEDSDLDFKITKNNTIVIRGENALLDPTDKDIAQEKEISGTVTDGSGEPLAGVNIIVNENERGTTTNFSGEYAIAVKTGDKLKFTYIGFSSQEFSIYDQKTLNVVLRENASVLDEVVLVSTGYQKSKKAEVTGNISLISQKQLENRITTDVTSRLEGVSSGLLLSNESEDEPTIIVGGQTTFSTDKQPLVVVDGFPISGGINSINPNDIQTISVLKDAAASAIWGTKSSNGVIVITTKSGIEKDGKVSVSYSSDLIVAGKPNFGNLNQASASDMVDFRQELLDSGIYTNYQTNVRTNGASNWIDPFDDAYVRLNGAPLVGLDPTWTQAQFDARVERLRQVDRLQEIRKHLYRTTFTQRHNLSLSGGSEKNKFFLSALLQNAPSKNIGNDNSTYSFNFKDNLKISDKIGLELGAYVLFNDGKRNNTAGDDILFSTGSQLGRYGITTSMFDQNGNLAPTSGEVTQSQVGFYNDLGFIKSTSNPIEQIGENDNSFRNLNLRLRAKLDYRLTSWLKASGAYSFERIDNYTRQHQSQDNFNVRRLNFRFTSINPDGSLLRSFPAGGILTENNVLITTKILRGQFDINKSFNKHRITAVLGIETRSQDIEARTDKYYGYDDRTLLFNNNLDVGDWITNPRPTYFGTSRFEFEPQNLTLDQEREASYYANASYTFDDKYVLSASARIDQANLFGAEKKFQYAPLWSTGFAWNMHKETFLDLPWISNLKPRVTFGYNARADRNTTTELVLEALSFFTDFNFNFRNYLSIATRPNPFLTWEKTYTTNAGLDFTLFNNKFSGSIDYYNRKSEDLIVEQVVNPTFGFTDATTNNGVITNKGLELNLTGKLIENANFGWTSNVIYTNNKNNIESVSPRLTQARFIVQQESSNSVLSRAPQQGFPVDAIFSWKYAGLDDTGAPQVFTDATDPDSDIVGYNDIADLDKSGVVHSGQLSPKHYGGFINTFRYKNFRLTASMSYKFGHVFRRPTFAYTAAVDRGIAIDDIANRWQRPGDENITDVPGIAALGSVSFFERDNYVELYSLSDKTIEKADNIRLNNISLSYDFPSKYLGKGFIKNLSFTTQLNNLGLIWKATKTDYDPEFVGKNTFSGTTAEGEVFPSRLQPGKEIIFGIRANF